MATTYKLDKIPTMDPAEFDPYRAAARTGMYFWQQIRNGVLDLGHQIGWIPVGKTTSQRVLNACTMSQKPDIAIMYRWQDNPNDMIWFHLYFDND